MKKLRRKDGFTLIEMLIVVAIVAILIAVSIPLVGSSLERARKATDAANERAAKGLILTCYMSDTEYAPGKKVIAYDDNSVGPLTKKHYAYDAVNGKLVQEKTDAYGKCDKHKDKYLIVWMTKNGDVYLWWNKGGFPNTAPITYYEGDKGDLCSNTLND